MIVFVTSIVFIYAIRIFKDIFVKKDVWGRKAGELKDRVHSIQKEYHDFKNSLSRNQRKLPENQRRLTSLNDRLSYAKKQRQDHFQTKNKSKKGYLLPIILLIVSVSLFYYIVNYTDLFQKYLNIIELF